MSEDLDEADLQADPALLLALDCLDVALRARHIGGAPWLHTMRTHELLAALQRHRRAKPDAKAAELVKTFADAVSRGEQSPPGKLGTDPDRRACAVDAFRDIARIVADPRWPRDARALEALARATPSSSFPPPNADAVVTFALPSEPDAFVRKHVLAARASSATARLFKIEAHLLPAPPEHQRPGELLFAVRCRGAAKEGKLFKYDVAAALAEPCATVLACSDLGRRPERDGAT